MISKFCPHFTCNHCVKFLMVSMIVCTVIRYDLCGYPGKIYIVGYPCYLKPVFTLNYFLLVAMGKETIYKRGAYIYIFAV